MMKRLLFTGLLLLVLVGLGTLLRERLMASDTPGAQVLVVDGWMPEEALLHATALIRERTYEQVITTGAVRPCAYPLANGGTLVIRNRAPLEPPLRVRLSGLRGAQWLMLCGLDTLSAGTVMEDRHTITVEGRPCDDLRLEAHHGSIVDGTAVLYVRGVSADGVNVHRAGAHVTIRSREGVEQAGSPTHADAAAQRLVALGAPAERVRSLPTWPAGRGRTGRAAQDAVRWATTEGIHTLDVATLGIHAGRTRSHYLRAAAGDVQVRVIALPDARCPNDRWWRNGRCWLDLLKELAGWMLGDGAEDQAGSGDPSIP